MSMVKNSKLIANISSVDFWVKGQLHSRFLSRIDSREMKISIDPLNTHRKCNRTATKVFELNPVTRANVDCIKVLFKCT